MGCPELRRANGGAGGDAPLGGCGPDERHDGGVVSMGRSSTFTNRVSWTALATGVTILVNLVSSILIARYLGPEQRGVYIYLGTVAATLVQFGNLGLHASNTVRLARDPGCLSRLIGNSILVSGMAGTALAVAAYAAVGRAAPDRTGLPVVLIALTLVAAPIRLQNLLNANLLVGMMRIGPYNLFELGVVAASLTKVGIVFYLLRQGLLAFLTVDLALELGLCGCYLWYITRTMDGGRFRLSLPLLRDSLGYGLRSYAACTLGFLLLKIDIYLVTAMLGLEAVGIYGLSAGLAAYLLTVPGVVARVLFPTLAAYAEPQQAFTNQVGRHVFMVMLLLAVVAGAAAPWLIPWLYGRAFEASVLPLVVLLPGALALGLQNVVGTQLVSARYPMFMVWVWAAGLAGNIVLNVTLMPIFGIMGAAWASTIAYVGVAAAVLGYYVRQTGSPLRDLVWLTRRDVAALCVRA